MYLGGLGHPPATSDIGNPEALFLRAQLVRWFDHWLKGIDNGITNEPRVTVAPERTAAWSEASLITADTFPLPGTVMKTYFFNRLKLSTRAPGGGRRVTIQPTTGVPALLRPIQNALGGDAAGLIAAVTVVNGILNSGGDILSPNIVTNLDSGAQSITFTSAALKQNLRVVGLPAVHLFVSSTDSDADYYVQILEKPPRGKVRLVSRGAFEDHAATFNAPHEIDFSPFGINHVFKAGNKIMVEVTSRDFPFFLPNFSQPKIRIYRDSQHPSNVALPVVP
jgi:putative CocE/NonD family hydrolase